MNSIKLIKFAFLFVVFCNVAVDISHKILLQNIAFKIFDGSEQVIWVSIINMLILLPFILLFSLSGFLSDKYNKRDVLVLGAISSFSLSLIMIVAYSTENFYFAMFVLFLLAVQSTIYSPAKFGLILDIYGKNNLAVGNSYLQSISIIAILFTMALFSYIFENFYISNNLQLISSKEELLGSLINLTYLILPIAFLEMLISVFILKKLKLDFKKRARLKLDVKSYFKGKTLFKNLKIIYSNHIIFLSVIGLSVFWGVSQGMLAVFPSYAKEYLHITNVFTINAVIASSGLGIAIGAYIYSLFSKHYIETGSIAIGAIGMSLMILMSTLVETTSGLILSFLLFGVFGGFFVVPLNSLIQFNSKKTRLGTILAGSNWLQSIFMFLVLCITTVVSLYNFDTLSIIYILLAITLIGTAYTIFSIPQSMILFFLKAIVGLKYKLDIDGVKNIPSSKGVLLLGNHVSWIDWAILYMATPRSIKFVMYKPIYNKWYLKWLLKIFNAIPISNSSSKQTILKIAKELDEGNAVVLFPEGGITRNGHLGEFKKGFEKILKYTKSDASVVAFYIRGLWESNFSRANKRFVKNRKEKNISVIFSKEISKEQANTKRVRDEVIKLSTKAWIEHTKRLETIPCEIFNRQKKIKNRPCIVDSTGVSLTGYKFLTASILFKNLLKKRVNSQNVAILLPTSAASSFINTSVLMLGKTCVNINYTSSLSTVFSSLKKAKIKQIITSKKFLEKLKEKGMDFSSLKSEFELIILEEEKAKINKLSALISLISVKILPTKVLKYLHIKKLSKKQVALILFSSGSESEPKGIELTHENIIGNCAQIVNIVNVDDDDIILSSLPTFHAFGICVTTFMPLIEGLHTVATPDPTDAQTIGKMVYENKVTIMCGTSTFYRLYILNKKLHPLMFQSLKFVIAGAEKLNEKVREDFKKKFSKDILEGYGVSETSPVVSCNLPDILSADFDLQRGNKIGSVGMPIPGTIVKIVNLDNFEVLKANEEGMILISGIQVMKGYLNDEQKSKNAFKTINDRLYYITGDKGKLDEDGFLYIVDRYSRFAKLGGEMISLTSVEKEIEKYLLSDEVEILASSIKDDKKGEKIVLLISNIEASSLSILKSKINKGFENKLMIPSLYFIVEEIPKLGTGKRDFNSAKKLIETLK